MMISPETYYEEDLQGKSKSAILQQISLLKKEIDRLKEVMESDENSPEAMVMPSPLTRIKCNREYLEMAKLALEEAGGQYTISPYTLIWNGDYYYLVGWYHEKERVTVFRVDRILTQPVILEEKAQPKPKKFDITHYTNEVFRMYDTEEIRKVTLCCENNVMKSVIDKFGIAIKVKKKDKDHFTTRVNVCTSPTFYGWVFQWGGAVKILAPENVVKEYREMVQNALERTPTGEAAAGNSKV